MKLSMLAGATSQTINIFIRDSSSTTGAGLSGLVYNTSGLTAYYALPKAAPVAITLATLAAATTAYSSGGFFELDATHMKGWYRLDLPDAAIASGRFVSLHLYGASSMAPLPIEIELTAWNNQDGVHGGMSALPNTAVTTNASLLTSGTGTAQLSVSSGQVILQTGTGTGQLDFTSGVVKCNNVQWLGGTIPAVSVTGVPLVDAKYLLGTVFPTPTVAGIPNVNVKTWNDLTTVSLPMPTYTQPTGFLAATFPSGTIANTTNITAGTITTVTTVTNQLTAAQIATGVWQDTTAGDFTTALSIGKSVMNGVTLGTGLTVARCTLTDTVTTYTGNTPQTGDAYARIGVAGVGLTNLGDTRIANLDAAVSSRSTYAGADTAGTTTLLSRVSAARAGYLDNLSAGAVVLAGSAPSWYTSPVDVSTNVAAIKAKTDNLPNDPAGLASLASAHGAGSWATATGFAVPGSAMTLSSTGLDAIIIEPGINARQALSIIGSSTAGKLSGVESGTYTFYAMNDATTPRIVAIVSSGSDRASVTLTLPA